MRRVPGLIVFLLAADVALGGAYLVNELLGNPRQGLSQLLDLGGEANLPTWYSSMQLFCAGLLMAAFAWPRVRRAERKTWALLLLPALLIGLSCDETAQIHERLGGHSDGLLPGGTRAGSAFEYTGIWMFVIGIPFILFLVWLIAKVRRSLSHVPNALARFALGFTLLLSGALVMDGMSNLFAMHSTRYNMSVLIEEMLEMVGGTLICWSALDLVMADRARMPRIVNDALTDAMLSGMGSGRRGPVVGSGAETTKREEPPRRAA